MFNTLAALGFRHMQNAHDRNKYVTVYLKNVVANQTINFKRYSPHVVTHYGEKYDYGSIMHYPRCAFSKNKKPTIVPKVC